MSSDDLRESFTVEEDTYIQFAELAESRGLGLGEFFSQELRSTVRMAELNEDPEIVQSSLLRDVVSAGLKDLAEGWEQRPTLPDILSPDWVDSLDEADMEFVDGYLRGIDFIATNHRVVWTPTGLFVFID